MKKLSLLIVMFSFMQIIGFAQENNCKLKVIYFHATMRCPTCLAIEKLANELITTDYAKKLESGEITFEALNIDEETNRDLCKKYKIYGSTLLLIKTGKEKVVDFSDQAFTYALENPEKYKKLLKEEIESMLK